VNSEQLAVKSQAGKEWHLLHSYRSDKRGEYFLTQCGDRYETGDYEHTAWRYNKTYKEDPEYWKYGGEYVKETRTYKHRVSRKYQVTCRMCTGFLNGLANSLDITEDIEPSVIK
jgi:hypothetical protein